MVFDSEQSLFWKTILHAATNQETYPPNEDNDK